MPTFYDEAGHRVATQYLFAVLHGKMAAERRGFEPRKALDGMEMKAFKAFRIDFGQISRLLEYRVGHEGLPGHPELGLTDGIHFSSGRLGHLWAHVNGVALSERRIVCCFSSDGSQMEGNSAEAARMAVAQQLDVKLLEPRLILEQIQ